MRRFMTPAWIARHVIAVVLVTVFILLGVWQLERAQAGNFISWAYALEWPIFAVFVVAVWIREVVSELRKDRPEKPRQSSDKATPAPMTSPFEADIVARRRRVDFGEPEASDSPTAEDESEPVKGKT